jgi:hypothetical protein
MTAYPAVIASWVQEVVRRQHEALETACWAALRDGCEVHVYPSPGFSTPWMLWHYDAGAWHPWGGLGAGFNTRQAAETQRDAVWGRP